jgi:putative peptidoglycan lipid II flippase
VEQAPSGDRPEPEPRDQVSRRNSAMVGTGILLSRITGLARERALGHFLGTSFAADAFTAAFRIPNLLQHLLGEGVLSASFIPVYSRLLSEGRDEEARRVAGAVVGLLAAAAGALTLIGVLFAEPLTLLIAAGLQGRPRTFELTVALVRILFPAIGFLVLSAWCLGVLNSHRRFFLPYVAPVIFNLVQIAVLVGAGLAVFSSGAEESSAATLVSLATWLAAGTVVGGALQFLVQLPAVLRVDRGLRPNLRTDLPGVRATIRAFGPVVGARGVVQLSSYVQVFLASFLAAGALATLRYAQILYMLPISLFGMSVAAAELPELSRVGSDQLGVTAARLEEGLARIAAFVVPAAVSFVVIGDLVTGALFQTGRFGRLETLAVWIVLIGYAFGLLATTSSRLLQSALYASGDTRTPARLAVLRVVVSAALGVVLMVQMDRLAVTESGIRLLGNLPAFGPLPDAVRQASGGEDLIRLGAAGLSIASGLAAWLEYVVLRRAVNRSIGRTTLAGGQLRPLVIAASAAVLTAGVVRLLVDEMHPLAGGAVAVGAMAVVYLATASKVGVSEIRSVLQDVRRRLPLP